MENQKTSPFVDGTVNTPCGVFQVFMTKEPLFSQALGKTITITISVETPSGQVDTELCALYDLIVQNICEYCSRFLDIRFDGDVDNSQNPEKYIVQISVGRNLNEMLRGVQSKYNEYVVLSLKKGEVNSRLSEQHIRIPVTYIQDRGKGIKFLVLRNEIQKNQAQA